MSLDLQAQLLTTLQTGKVWPVGCERHQEVSCRLLSATAKDLRALVAAGRFREDLFYRLDVQRVIVPPLRQRGGDVLPLVRHFASRFGRSDLEITPPAVQLLEAYSWPGNVRELENEVRRWNPGAGDSVSVGNSRRRSEPARARAPGPAPISPVARSERWSGR